MNKLILLICVLCVLGCAKHENFPDPLAISEPLSVTNLSVTHPEMLTYTLEWDISDDSNVDHYNIYILAVYSPPELVGTTESTLVDVMLPIALGNIMFGVSVVTDENVEGSTVYAVAP